MAGRDRQIDPKTGDYIRDAATGSWKTTRDSSTAVYHQIKGNLGGWAGDELAGSRFHRLAQAKSSLQTPAVIEDMSRQAMAPLVEDGRITEPVLAQDRNVDKIANSITVTDLQTESDLDLTALIPMNV